MQKRGPPRPFNNQLIQVAKGGLSTQDVLYDPNLPLSNLYADNLELNESLFAGPGLDTPAHSAQVAGGGPCRMEAELRPCGQRELAVRRRSCARLPATHDQLAIYQCSLAV